MSNRIIKFRAWNPITKQMLEVTDISWLRGEVKRIQAMVRGAVPVRDGWFDLKDGDEKKVILQQFCGLHDKNGKEIWEGDVVRKSDFNGLGYTRVRTCEIAWHEKYARWDIRTTLGDWYALGEYEEKQLEVIGNIYENPSLLE